MRGGRVTHLAALALAACSLAACGPVQSAGDVVAAAPAAIDQASQAYQDAKAFVELALPYLSADRQAKVRAIEAKIEGYLFTARIASTIAGQVAALDQANAAIAELKAPAD